MKYACINPRVPFLVVALLVSACGSGDGSGSEPSGHEPDPGADADDRGPAIDAAMPDAGELVDAIAPGTSPDAELDAPAPLSVVGSYELRSVFELAASDSDGDIIRAVELVIAAPIESPGAWIVDAAISQAYDPTVRSSLQAVRALLLQEVNAAIPQIAPDLAPTLESIRQATVAAASTFRTVSRLDLTATETEYQGSHTVTGFIVENDGQDQIISFAEVGIAPAESQLLTVELLAAAELALGSHTMQPRYGQSMRAIVEQVIIPRSLAGARSIEDLYRGLVDCNQFGVVISGLMGFGSSATWAAPCWEGMAFEAVVASDSLARFDSVLITASGVTRGEDLDGDRTVEVLSAGQWSGTITRCYACAAETIAQSTFLGARIQQP
jgi:hypothetical protein